MAIKKITIRNFRSIVADEFEPKALNIVVGANDVGKSNYLRALNLFFNNQTEPNVPLNWKVDYSQNVEKRKGKAEEISIEITFAPPQTFTSTAHVVWRKSWRKESHLPYRNEKSTEDKKVIGGRQKLDIWLERTRFKYVPAIKGPEYFRTLLRDLHDTLALTIDESLRNASTSFLEQLRLATSGISKEVKDVLLLDSKLQLPSSLGNFFEVLDFETTTGTGRSFSLQQRGDGVKVRHIPAILKFLADQESLLAAKGKPRVTTIWGYEEPENNLELAASFEAARNFRTYAQEIQTFLTSHSPAFYSLANGVDNNVGAWCVAATEAGTRLRPQSGSDFSDLDKSLGLMPLIAPYVADAEARVQSLRTQLESAVANAKPVIFVAGPTDEVYLKKALTLLRRNNLQARFDIKFIGVSGPGGDTFAGDSSLKQVCSFIKHNRDHFAKPTLVLFDWDARQTSETFSNLRVFSIPVNSANGKMKRGIENLIDESAFLQSDYKSKTEIGEYGEQKSIQIFEKAKCCDRICNGSIPPAILKSHFAKFEVVIQEIEQWIASWES